MPSKISQAYVKRIELELGMLCVILVTSFYEMKIDPKVQNSIVLFIIIVTKKKKNFKSRDRNAFEESTRQVSIL